MENTSSNGSHGGSDTRSHCFQDVLLEYGQRLDVIHELGCMPRQAQEDQGTWEDVERDICLIEDDLAAIRVMVQEQQMVVQRAQALQQAVQQQGQLLSHMIAVVPRGSASPTSSSTARPYGGTSTKASRGGTHRRRRSSTRSSTSGANNSSSRKGRGGDTAYIPTLPHVSQEELDTVPYYARGRVRLEHLNTVVDALNVLVKQKYTLMASSVAHMSDKELKWFNEWRSQESSHTQGHYFFHADDLKRCSVMTANHTSRSVLQILRDIGFLKQVPGKSYLVVENSD